jgi:hypothetical protein
LSLPVLIKYFFAQLRLVEIVWKMVLQVLYTLQGNVCNIILSIGDNESAKPRII